MAEMDQVTKEEFLSWKENKVTLAVMKELLQVKEELKEILGNGGSLAKDAPATEYFVGRIQGLNEVLNIDYEEPVKPYGH